jgi:arylsulfatase A-like enzyme
VGASSARLRTGRAGNEGTLEYSFTGEAGDFLLGNDPEPQLYDLESDPGERHNVAAQFPDKAAELAALLEQIRRTLRTRP